jgi:crotonobetainyl-CoA:carnitine CoA-transferase CaiB-like acyl-CoA transferase
MLAGPICGMRLGDLGGEVIKIEPPGTGEWTRTHGFANARMGGQTTAFLALNRNKLSASINLKDPEGLEAFYDLVRRSDVFLQNYRVGTAERIGVGYEQLREVNPRIIYCQISGYGEDGPYRDRPGQDLLVQGYSGSMWSVGSRHDPPTPGALWAVDAMTGYQAAIGILAALRERELTGEGQKVSVDMWSVVMDCQTQEFTTYLNCGILPERSEQPFAHVWCNPPYGAYPTNDGYVLLSQLPIDTLGDALGDDRLREISDWEEAHERRDEIAAIVAGITPTKSTSEWLEIFDQYRLWTAPVYTYQDVENDPHVRARGMIVDIEHPQLGTIRQPAPPLRLSGTPGPEPHLHPPMLGENTEAVLRAAGVSDDRLSALRSRGAI